MVRKAIFLLIFCFFKVAHAATVECIDQGYLGFMRFNGEITSGDLRIVMKCWDYLNLKIEPKEQKAKFVEAKSSPGTTPKTKGSIFIVLSSAGGSVYEAMEIGRFVRKKRCMSLYQIGRSATARASIFFLRVLSGLQLIILEFIGHISPKIRKYLMTRQ